MGTRELTGLLVASALVTLDGTAAATALPAVGRDLELRFSELQWIANASLLTMAALLLPAGDLADKFGRGRASVASVPELAGAASRLNHAAARGAGLIDIAALGSIAAAPASAELSPEGLAER